MRPRVNAAVLFAFSMPWLFAQQRSSAPAFPLEQVLRAPFTTSLTASPKGNAVAWVTNAEGRRNVWFATLGKGDARQLTHYSEDDGQDTDDLAFTPDGAKLAYTHGGPVQGNDHPVPNPAHIVPDVAQQVFLIDTEGKGSPRLIGNGHAAAISPRGDVMAFLRAGQIYTVDLKAANAKPAQLFQMRGHQGNLRFSPDGNALAFVSSRGDHALVGIYRLDTEQIVFADPGTSQDSDPAWSSDSTQVAFIRNPTDFDRLENRWAHEAAVPWAIRVADARTGVGRELWHADKGSGSLFKEVPSRDNLLWTKSGRIVFPWEKDGWRHLYSVQVSGGEAKLLTPGEFEVEHVTYAPKDDAVVYSSNQRIDSRNDVDLRHLWRVAADGGKTPVAITHGSGIEVWPVVTAANDVAMLRSDSHLPVRPAALTGNVMQDIAPQIIPHDFPAAQMVEPQQVLFPATDGWMIHGQLFVPKNGKAKHPAIVFIHGGSRRQMYLGFNPMEYYSNTYAYNEYLCALGYVVLSVNYRSGVGYGMLFRQADNYGFNGASEYNDILGAGKFLQARADVDRTRIGLYGGSYGGFLTAMGLARNSDVFAAGADYHGVHDWVSEMGLERNSDESVVDRVDRRNEMQRRAWLSSPMAYLDTWKSPVLLVQGDDDRNVGFDQTVRLANALRAKGVHVEERVFPDEVHDFLLHRDWVETYKLTTDFFDRELMQRK